MQSLSANTPERQERLREERQYHQDVHLRFVRQIYRRQPLRSNEPDLVFFSVLVFSPAGNLVRGSGLNPNLVLRLNRHLVPGLNRHLAPGLNPI